MICKNEERFYLRISFTNKNSCLSTWNLIVFTLYIVEFDVDNVERGFGRGHEEITEDVTACDVTAHRRRMPVAGIGNIAAS